MKCINCKVISDCVKVPFFYYGYNAYVRTILAYKGSLDKLDKVSLKDGCSHLGMWLDERWSIGIKLKCAPFPEDLARWQGTEMDFHPPLINQCWKHKWNNLGPAYKNTNYKERTKIQNFLFCGLVSLRSDSINKWYHWYDDRWKLNFRWQAFFRYIEVEI